MSSTSLYGTTGNVTVSANNLTTLYSAQPGNVVTANVPDRNFTTLYATSPSQVLPTKPYGNANVEAFLNAGTDGSNIVNNINMSGTLTVGGLSNLGNVGNVHITGGSSGYVLTTDGVGNLIWEEPQGGGGNVVPYIHFDVSSNGNNQSFTDTNIGFYTATDEMAVMKNGINIEPSLYAVAGNVLTINILLATGDTIDVLPSGGGGGSGGLPAGIPGAVQYNGGYSFAGANAFTFDSGSNTLTVTNIVSNGIGLTNLTGANVTGYVPNATHANISDSANTIAGANVTGYVPNATHANISDAANVAYSVSVANVVGIGNIATINKDGNAGNILYGNGVFATAPAGSTYGNSNVAAYLPTYTGNLNPGNLDVSGNVIVQRAYEKFTTVASGITGTINYDVLNQSILYYSANASANCTLNIRGNSSSTLDSILPTGDTLTVVFLNTVGTTGYVVSNLQIDGTAITPKYVNGTAPTFGTRLSDAVQSYTYTISKTGANSYVVLAGLTEYK